MDEQEVLDCGHWTRSGLRTIRERCPSIAQSSIPPKGAARISHSAAMDGPSEIVSDMQKGSVCCPFREKPCNWPDKAKALDFFLDTCSLTRTIAEIVKLGATNITATLNQDFLNLRAVGLEHALHPFAMRDLAHGKG